jgi:hypothetical protein
MSHTICCRAKVSDDCLDGQPTRVQFGKNLPMSEDGTYEPGSDDPGSIVCDACYTLLTPFTPSQQALSEELPDAIALLRESLKLLREHDAPEELVAQAEAAALAADSGSARQSSASVLAELARREVKRREAAESPA